jgi:hypothetical protein
MFRPGRVTGVGENVAVQSVVGVCGNVAVKIMCEFVGNLWITADMSGRR